MSKSERPADDEAYLASTGRRRLKNLCLHVSRQVRIDWQDYQLFDLGAQLSCSFLHIIATLTSHDVMTGESPDDVMSE